MEPERVSKILGDLVERLASIEHNRWAHWQRYVHSKCIPLGNGALLIPADLVTRWTTQIATSYAELSETEKESDREQVRTYLALIVQALTEQQE